MTIRNQPLHLPELRWPAFLEINVYFRNPVMRAVIKFVAHDY